jgi:methionine-rich copper-binding protein CopC
VQGRRVFWGIVVGVALLGLVAAGSAAGSSVRHGDSPNDAQDPPANVHHDVSPPLSSIAPATPPPTDQKKDKEPKKGPPVPAQSASDPVVQSSLGSASAPALGLGFEGIGDGFSGPSGAFAVSSAPPDPNGAVGPNNFVEIVNQSFAVFDKSGTPLYGPVPTNTVFAGFGGGCETNDDGDATVEYDKLANRWVISQLSVSTTPYLQCVAVSTSGDPTGSYYRYSFQYANFPDYPKLGVWPDAYYMTFNQFRNGVTFVGPEACAYDRNAMLSGQAATQQCFTLSSSYGSLLPSDLDGSTPPPASSPNYLLAFATNSLQLWKFHVDWTIPTNSTLNGPTSIPVASFSPACNGGGTCIPQSGTTQQLDSLADRLMYRLAYRNFSDHESLVVDHSVTAGNTTVGVRWYELRDPNGTPTVYQQGTYAPDSTDRWMGSIAMDRNGDVALGFSVSSPTSHPGIHYTGRLAGDPLGTMTQGEGTILDGTGSQTSNLSRWGDYTSMSVDPSDDCTFWYTNEYLSTSGSFNWHTRVGTFKLPGCGASGPSDFSLSASPSSLSVAAGANATSTISTAVTSGSTQTVNLSASGQPAGTTISFNPASVNAGGSSTMTVSTSSNTAPGTYTLTVTGTGTTTHTTTVTLTVTAAAPPPQGVVNGGFETGSLNGWSTSGAFAPRINTTPHTGSYSAQLGSTSAVIGDSTLTQTVAVPSGSSRLTFWYQPHCPDTITYDQIQMQIRNTSGATLATVVNVCSNSGAWTSVSYDTSAYAGQNVVLWFNDHDDGYPTDPTYFLLDDVALGSYAPAPSDFSLSASPSSLSVAAGANATSTISTAVTSGSTQTVNLSASGQPAGTTISFNPASVNAGGSSTMTVSTNASTAPGTYTLTVTGTGTSTHTTTVTLTVTAAAPTFSLSASPTSQTVVRGSGTSYAVTVTPANGFNGQVNLSVSGLPSRMSASFSPNPATSTSTLTLQTNRKTRTGTYQLTITGTSGGITQTTTVTLVVQ